MADNSQRIAEIEEILSSGAKKVATDGTSVEYDFASLRRELRKLQAADDNQKGRRPVASRIYLGGF